MRVGSNPLKTDIQTLHHKKHRIILPFWIPNVSEAYFQNQPEVLKWCLQSLTDTVNASHTAITLINNGSCSEASDVAELFVKRGLIDKYVVLKENRGKLESILSEAKASYEEYITICDSDFLFFPGWEKKVSDIMQNFPRAGMVTCFPAAHLTYFYNSNIIYALLKSGKVIKDKDIDLFEQGIGHSPKTGLFARRKFRKKHAWRKRHFYLTKNNCMAVTGAVHALATFRKEVVHTFSEKKVPYVFKNGYEHEFIDMAVEKSGFLRLSTPDLNAYHMGNTIPEKIISLYRNKMEGYSKNELVWDRPYKLRNRRFYKVIFPLTSFLFRIARKFKFI